MRYKINCNQCDYIAYEDERKHLIYQMWKHRRDTHMQINPEVSFQEIQINKH